MRNSRIRLRYKVMLKYVHKILNKNVQVLWYVSLGGTHNDN